MQIQKQEPPPRRAERESDREREMQLADVIYLFVEEGGKGIRLYDRSDDISAIALAESLKEGEFITDSMVELVEWDKDLNIPNGSILVRYREGTRKETTYIVSGKKITEVLNTISKGIEEGKEYFIVDSKEKEIVNEGISQEEKEKLNSSNKFDKNSFLTDDLKQINPDDKYSNKKDGKIEGVEPTVEIHNENSKQEDKVLSPEESLIKMINANKDILLANGFTEQDIQDALVNGSINMDNKMTQHLFLIESLKAFGIMDESKMVQLDKRIGGGYFTDGDIYGYDVTYDEKQYRIVLDDKELPPKESLEFGKSDDIKMLLKQKEMLEKFSGFYNSRTMSLKLKEVKKQIELVQKGQTKNNNVVTPRDIAELDKNNKIVLSEIAKIDNYNYMELNKSKINKILGQINKI